METNRSQQERESVKLWRDYRESLEGELASTTDPDRIDSLKRAIWHAEGMISGGFGFR